MLGKYCHPVNTAKFSWPTIDHIKGISLYIKKCLLHNVNSANITSMYIKDFNEVNTVLRSSEEICQQTFFFYE